MNEPIKAGDECIIISGAFGASRARNRGRRVVVMHRNGPELLLHTPEGLESHGQVWRCRSKDGLPFARIDGPMSGITPADQVDCAESWLQKAEPEPPSPRVADVVREVSA